MSASPGTQPPPPPMTYGTPPMPPQKTMIPIVGGALLIVAGILAIILWGMLVFAGAAFGAAFGLLDPTGAGGFLAGILLVCGLIGIVLSVITLLGGVMAVQRKMWGLALTGAILGIFTIGLYGLASILSIVGLILVAISRKEFP